MPLFLFDAIVAMSHSSVIRTLWEAMKNRRPMQLRLPREIKDWIKSESIRNGSSQNSEVIRAIRAAMDVRQFARCEREEGQ